MQPGIDLKELENPNISLEDKRQILLLDFLAKAKSIGSHLSVKNLEPILPIFGIPLFGKEHLLLVMTDHDTQYETAGAPDINALIAEYPFWSLEIQDDFKIRHLTSKIALRSDTAT